MEKRRLFNRRRRARATDRVLTDLSSRLHLRLSCSTSDARISLSRECCVVFLKAFGLSCNQVELRGASSPRQLRCRGAITWRDAVCHQFGLELKRDQTALSLAVRHLARFARGGDWVSHSREQTGIFE